MASEDKKNKILRKWRKTNFLSSNFFSEMKTNK